MEAANRGAYDEGANRSGSTSSCRTSNCPTPIVTPELCFQFHYFALRKMHFLLRARAVAVFPGGFGTFDEMFELLTLIQTGKMRPLPILLFGREFWDRVVDFQALADEGVISPARPRPDHLVRERRGGVGLCLQPFYDAATPQGSANLGPSCRTAADLPAARCRRIRPRWRGCARPRPAAGCIAPSAGRGCIGLRPGFGLGRRSGGQRQRRIALAD